MTVMGICLIQMPIRLLLLLQLVCLHHYDVSLIFCFEKNGVLENVNDENSVINAINHENYHHLKESNKLFAGILPKIDNAFDAINKGVNEVIIGNSAHLASINKRSRRN